MAKRLFVAGFLLGAVLFAVSGCTTLGETEVAEEAKVAEVTEVAKEAEEAKEAKVAEVVEEAKAVEVAKEAKGHGFVVRVNCAASEPYTDKAGNEWLPDQYMEQGRKWGAVDGMTVDRGDLGIAGADAPKVYETERYSMEAYKFVVPNGKYTVRLHFAETFDGIVGEGERVFSVTVNGRTVLEDFDPFKEGGGFQKPIVKEFKGVDVTDGQLVIGFTPNIENPEINGIEIVSE